jgi:hypothetical protein
MQNPFKKFFRNTMMISAGAITTAFAKGEPVKLVNTKTRFVVVEFQNGKPTFHDRFLEAEMKETGILIPPHLASDFEGKEVIFLGEENFEKAFIEVYYPYCIANSLYQWEN